MDDSFILFCIADHSNHRWYQWAGSAVPEGNSTQQKISVIDFMPVHILDPDGNMVWSEDQPNSSKKTKTLGLLLCGEEDDVAETTFTEFEREWTALETDYSYCCETGHVFTIKIIQR